MKNTSSPDHQRDLVAALKNGPSLFSLGHCVATPGALAMLDRQQLNAHTFIQLHQHGSWGQLDAQDSAMNQQALVNGGRIFSAYTLADGKRLYVITEAQDDNGVRLCTTVLKPSEY